MALGDGSRGCLRSTMIRSSTGWLAFRTQHYVNTHKSNYRIEQSVLDLLGLRKSLPARFRRTRTRQRGAES